jgi:colanic acid/amylovoran biosynthesis protein
MPCAFTWGNKGDAALLIAAAQALRLHWPNAEITFQSFTPYTDAGKFDERFVGMPISPTGKLNWMMHWIPGWSPLLVGLACVLTLGYLTVHKALRRVFRVPYSDAGLFSMKPFMNALREADLVVAMPGGYLQATAWNDDYWLLHWLTLMIAKLEAKPVILYAQSVGPFTSLHSWLARKLLRRLDLILVREEFSATRMEQLGIPAGKVRVVPDAAFGLSDPGDSYAEVAAIVERAQATGRPLVGISVRSHHFPGVADRHRAMEKYLAEVARVADGLIETLGARVFFVPQCIGIGGNDLEVSRQVLNRMRHRSQVEIVSDDLSPLALKSLYGQLTLLVGTRMHANILALCAGTPVVAISYERKTDGIMQRLGLSGYVVDINEVEGQLQDRVSVALANSTAYRATLADVIPKIRAEALRTPNLIAQRLSV